MTTPFESSPGHGGEGVQQSHMAALYSGKEVVRASLIESTQCTHNAKGPWALRAQKSTQQFCGGH